MKHQKYITQRKTIIPVVLTKEITDLEQVNPERVKTIVIFDDCVTERNQSVQCKIFTKGHHLNCHIIYLTQLFYDIKKIVRKNTNVLAKVIGGQQEGHPVQKCSLLSSKVPTNNWAPS